MTNRVNFTVGILGTYVVACWSLPIASNPDRWLDAVAIAHMVVGGVVVVVALVAMIVAPWFGRKKP